MTTYKTRDTYVEFKGVTLHLFQGLPVTPITSGGTAGKFFLESFPIELFPPNSIIRHDAIHYGVVLDRSQVDSGPTEVAVHFKTEEAADRFIDALEAIQKRLPGIRAIASAIYRIINARPISKRPRP